MANLTLERFWQYESHDTNQMHHRLMGSCRWVLLNGAVVGVVAFNRKQRRYC